MIQYGKYILFASEEDFVKNTRPTIDLNQNIIFFYNGGYINKMPCSFPIIYSLDSPRYGGFVGNWEEDTVEGILSSLQTSIETLNNISNCIKEITKIR